MPKKIPNIQVVKVPLRRSSTGRPQQFPRMPRLYLELIENKAKIKQDLINKEHVPTVSDGPYGDPTASGVSPVRREDIPSRGRAEETERRHAIDDASTESSEIARERPKYKGGEKNESRLDRLLKDDDDLSSISTADDSLKSEVQPPSPVRSEKSSDSEASDLSIEEIKREDDARAEVESRDSDNLSDRLKALLGDDTGRPQDHYEQPSPVPSHRSFASDKYSRHRDATGHSITRPGAHDLAPTLSELEERGGYVPKRELRDINHTTRTEQHEDDSKRELLFKFDLLRKSYPNSVIPEFTIHSDLASMQKAYDDTVRRLSLDSSVESYKTYLVYGFMGCEFVFGNFLGFDMQGFTQQQIVSMNSYEKLLIELGEKSYVPSGSKWPVELRLLFMIVMNAAFFVISKMIMKKTGANLMGMINNMQGPASAGPPPQRKRKMRGPNIDLGDLPDMSGV